MDQSKLWVDNLQRHITFILLDGSEIIVLDTFFICDFHFTLKFNLISRR